MTETTDAPALRVAPDGALPLPDGGWVCFRDPKSVKQLDRKNLTRRLDSARAKGDTGDYTLALSTADATLALAITAWSYAMPVPAESIESIDELPIPHYDALCELVEPFKDALFPKTASPAPDDVERTSPTGPSSA